MAVTAAVSTGATVLAMRHTSTTFDEIVMIAAGARGFETGRFDLVPEHPPLTQYLYGLPVFLDGAEYPEEPESWSGMRYRYTYAQKFFWRVGNDPERVAFLGRLMSAACVLALVLAVFTFTRQRYDDRTALLAALLVAFLPDSLAHGGVAYNDTPLALFYFCAIWAMDAAVRAPSVARGATAGVLAAIALGIKHSAVALGPAAVLIVLGEAFVRRFDRAWAVHMARAVGVGVVAAYLALVAVYRGDFALSEFAYGLRFTILHASAGHGAPGYLLGDMSVTGWWYFFPVAFLFKTPAALHLLIVLALAGAFRSAPRSWEKLLSSPIRGVVVGAVVFGLALLSSNLVIGFRYALPLLPLLCVLVAVGVSALWDGARKRLRVALGALVAWYAAASLTFYPYFLSFTSEYVPSRDRGHEVLLDSSLDWGQGLLELRRFMEEEDVSRVYLSYFGSALPDGYGIDYISLPSFFPLESRLEPPKEEVGSPANAGEPRFLVVSATNLHGVYLPGDPFARLRMTEPYEVLAHSLFVYRVEAGDDSD